MTAAEVQALYTAASCYRCYSNADEATLLKLALLAQIALAARPDAITDAATLLENAPCACYGFSEAEMLELSLLVQWLVALGGLVSDQEIIDNAPCACVGVSFFQTLKLSLLGLILEASGGSLPPDVESFIQDDGGDAITTNEDELLLVN